MLARIGAAVAILATFALGAAATLVFLPEPFRAVDYMLAGSVGTMASLITTFIAVGLIGSNVAKRNRARERSQPAG
jgi:hypothetical protein